LSWIKKIFTMFQNDDHDEFDDIQEEKTASKLLIKQQNQKKEVEARVLYQYPKGQFRFPLIPDKNDADVQQREGKERPDRVQPFTEVKPLFKEQSPVKMKEKHSPGKGKPPKSGRNSVKETAVSFHDESSQEHVPKFKFETKKDSGPKFRQPFKPTEIPSPIYAFNRPPRKVQQNVSAEEVEYELKGFEQLRDEAHELHEQLINETFEVSTDENVHAVISEEVSVNVQMDNKHLQDAINVDEAASVIEMNEMVSKIEVKEDEIDPETEVLNHIMGLETRHEFLEDKDEAEVNHHGLTVETMDSQLAEDSLMEGEDHIVNEHDNLSPMTDANAEAEKPVESRTRTLPFNVIMLKQDKKKWVESQGKINPLPRVEDAKDVSGPMTTEIHPASTQPEISEQSVPGNANIQPAASHVPSSGTDRDERAETSSTVPPSGTDRDESAEASSNVPPSGTDRVERAETSSNVPSSGTDRDERAEISSRIPPSDTYRDEIAAASQKSDYQVIEEYEFPPLDLLSPPVFKEPDPQWLAEQEQMLNDTLKNFNVGAKVVNMTQGPSVTRFEVQPEPGVKVNKITNLSDDIKLSLAAKDIRIEAPIPGKHTIGIEVPNHSSRPVLLSEILQSGGFLDHESPLSVALGLDIAGNPIVTDLKKMPHGLIAGATGSGKSVCINTMLVSLLYKAHPDEVKLLLIDPKMVELAPYNQIPHLVSPVITDVKAATAALKWAVEEMERRYELFAHTGVRDINRFNELAVKHRRFSDKLPFIVIVIDELADLMMMAPADVEEAICRIAQKARACGIHLIIATQRPSVDVITGLIKANVPTRIAFSVSSQVDSRTIIDISGAEKLLGRGDMLFLENGSSKPFRLQGTFVTDNEIDDIVAFVREQRAPQYLFEQEELLRKAQVTEDEDELFYEACEFVVEQGGASTSSVQRRFKIGYNRAARLIEMMQQQGFISEGRGSKPRDVLISAADLESLQETSTFN
jgi:DNA segregation ATPase FtsK/SpoIIIE, S-DNA-T family